MAFWVVTVFRPGGGAEMLVQAHAVLRVVSSFRNSVSVPPVFDMTNATAPATPIRHGAIFSFNGTQLIAVQPEIGNAESCRTRILRHSCTVAMARLDEHRKRRAEDARNELFALGER
jgi:hypothetical protein